MDPLIKRHRTAVREIKHFSYRRCVSHRLPSLSKGHVSHKVEHGAASGIVPDDLFREENQDFTKSRVKVILEYLGDSSQPFDCSAKFLAGSKPRGKPPMKQPPSPWTLRMTLDLPVAA